MHMRNPLASTSCLEEAQMVSMIPTSCRKQAACMFIAGLRSATNASSIRDAIIGMTDKHSEAVAFRDCSLTWFAYLLASKISPVQDSLVGRSVEVHRGVGIGGLKGKVE